MPATRQDTTFEEEKAEKENPKWIVFIAGVMLATYPFGLLGESANTFLRLGMARLTSVWLGIGLGFFAALVVGAATRKTWESKSIIRSWGFSLLIGGPLAIGLAHPMTYIAIGFLGIVCVVCLGLGWVMRLRKK